MTAKIEVNGKVLTASDEAIAPLHASAMFKFDKSIPFKNVKLLSAVIEPVRYPRYESELQQYEACLKKEKEKEKKEPEKKETAKTDDDFWDGGKEKTEKRKIVLSGSNDDFWNGGEENKKETKTASIKKVNDKDFWDGENEKPDADKPAQNAFRIINEYSQYNRNNDGKYSWVEDTDGNIIIPKGQYYISSFKDGLAEVEKIIRTDYYDFVKDKKVQLFEKCFMDENGNKLPPKTYSLSYGHYYAIGVLWDAAMSKAEIEEVKRKWTEKDKSAYQQLKSIYSGQGYDID
jgi:hypothetical protein